MKDFKPPKTEYRELWRPMADTNEMYWVSDKGRMYSKHTNKILSPRIGKDNEYARVKKYPSIQINERGHSIHRLVMSAFKPIENSADMFVNHIDLDKSNNDISNLEWCTPRENSLHYVKNGDVNQKGECNNNAKLTKESVKEIREMYNPDKHTATGIANMYNVTPSTIINLLTNKSWYDESYVPTYKIKRTNIVRKGTDNHMCTLTEKDVLEIRHVFEANPNLRIVDISKKYGVSKTAIRNILTRKRWEHI